MRRIPRLLCHAVPDLSRALLLVTVLTGCGSVVVIGPGGGGDAGATDVPPAVDRVPPTDLPLATDRPLAQDVPRTCTTSADCGPGQECQGPEGCGMPWVCGPGLGRPCTDDLAPFCGCDGVTYYGSSTCPSRPFRFRGECSVPPPPPPPACSLPDGRACAVGARCPLDRCTTCQCFAAGDLRCFNICAQDAGIRLCRSGADCGPNEMCMGPEGCGVPWVCRPGPIGCTADLSPFCGCDGVTFFSSSSCPSRPYQSRGPCLGTDAGVAACNIRGVQCPVNSRCQIDRCTICTCNADRSTSCAVASNCIIDAGAPATDGGAAPRCDAMDARGQGACDRFLGYAWTGSSCRGLSGCSCIGADCMRLFNSPGECEERFGQCPSIGP